MTEEEEKDENYTGEKCPECGKLTLILATYVDACNSCNYGVSYW